MPLLLGFSVQLVKPNGISPPLYMFLLFLKIKILIELSKKVL